MNFTEAVDTLFEEPEIPDCGVHLCRELQEYRGSKIPGNSGANNMCVRKVTYFRVWIYFDTKDAKGKEIRLYSEAKKDTLREGIIAAFEKIKLEPPAWVQKVKC